MDTRSTGNGKGWSMGKRVGAGVGLGVAGMELII
jgi:hypothetical protein